MIPIPDYATVIWPQVLAFFRNRFPGRDTHPESFLGKAARALARTISYLLVSLQSVDQDAVPSQKTSRTALNNMAFAYGIPSNAGGYGSNGAVAATGGVATLTGTNGTVFPNGTLFTAPDGVTILQLSGAQTIPGNPPGSGSISGNIIAVTAGSAGNLPANTLITLQGSISGADSSFTLTTGLSGGLDSEANLPLLNRILGRWQNAPKGGASPDYRAWAEGVAGVSRAYVYLKRSGSGSVDIVITSASSGLGRDPGATVATNVGNIINGNPSANPPIIGLRPVTASGTNVRRPYMPSGLAIRVRVITSQNKYAFDWSLGASTLTVASWSSPTLTMNQALPASLTAAIDTYNASPSTVQPPRLQVIATGMPSPGIATPVNVIGYNAGTKTLTLQTPIPSAWTAPSPGDSVYPYGPAVPIVAAGSSAAVIAGIQGYVDSLGPSRQSGYANPLDVWIDTASFIALGEVALDATDTDGLTRPVSRVLAATINGSAQDVQATDTLSGIQLLYCASIAVTD